MVEVVVVRTVEAVVPVGESGRRDGNLKSLMVIR
jgi:hypothetical protein